MTMKLEKVKVSIDRVEGELVVTIYNSCSVPMVRKFSGDYDHECFPVFVKSKINGI